jgi:site-specific DNA-methyltransferase (adenine-specific)
MKPYYDEDGITIYHGDCRDVLSDLPQVDLLITDPPYGVNWQSGYRHRKFDCIEGDKPEDEMAILESLRLALMILKNRRHLYIFGNLNLATLQITSTCELIWDKGRMGMGDVALPWAPQHETITFGVYVDSSYDRKSERGNLSARLRKGSIISVQRLDGNVYQHPTEKPILLLRQLIESSSVIGELVLDPFMGVGSTLVAARIEGRKAIGIEIEERYCETAAKRLAQRCLSFEYA